MQHLRAVQAVPARAGAAPPPAATEPPSGTPSALLRAALDAWWCPECLQCHPEDTPLSNCGDCNVPLVRPGTGRDWPAEPGTPVERRVRA